MKTDINEKSNIKEDEVGCLRSKLEIETEKAKELRVTMQNANLLLGEWKLDMQRRKDMICMIFERL